MKIGCFCGGTIHDITDAEPTKAHFVPDEDYFDMMDEFESLVKMLTNVFKGEGSVEDWQKAVYGEKAKTLTCEVTPDDFAIDRLWSIFQRYTRTLYQCHKCGRLYIEDWKHELHCYQPHDEATLRDILSSNRKTHQRTHLIARWDTNNYSRKYGVLYLNNPVEHEVTSEEFDHCEELEVRYYEVFERMKSREKLRSASLRKDGKVVHVWNL